MEKVDNSDQMCPYEELQRLLDLNFHSFRCIILGQGLFWLETDYIHTVSNCTVTKKSTGTIFGARIRQIISRILGVKIS